MDEMIDKDKDIPKSPMAIITYTCGDQIPGCPTCAKMIHIGQRKCQNCGQAIYWGRGKYRT